MRPQAADAMEFFRLSAGQWRSQRTTHHLAFRRAEVGELHITVETLEPESDRVVALCQMHDIDPALAAGGSAISWHGVMAWDQADKEAHQDRTVMVLVPDADNARQGRLLREKGYAELMPVVGRYEMDDEDALILTTEYETMSARERFSFVSPTLRMRTSTVKRFGGFSTASFCTEARVDVTSEVELEKEHSGSETAVANYSIFSVPTELATSS